MIDLETNCKIVIQCDTKERLNIVRETIIDRFPECVVYDTGIRPNTREPYPDGVHSILFLALEAVDID